VAEAVARNEIADMADHGIPLRYRTHIVDHHGDRTREVIEAREGTVSRTVLRDGQPLSEAEDKAERDRLEAMLRSPEIFTKHRKRDGESRKLATDLIRLMPDAMLYTYAPGQPQTAARVAGGGRQIVLDYRPNPKWHPPTATAQALTGLQGRMWVDPASHQLLRMEGEVSQAVNLGMGLLARIYPGGRLLLEQTDAGGGRWIYTHFTEVAQVRALMVKTLDIHTEIAADQFRPLPRPVTYQEAIHMLLDTPPAPF
jgi:hypothetical protein